MSNLPEVVSNSSPLIHLAKIQKLKLLRDLFGEIMVPEAVMQESTRPAFEDAASIQQVDWITTKPIQDERVKEAFLLHVDEGEAEAITLAIEEQADVLLLDDYDARMIARKYDLTVTGVVGVLLRAKYTGKIDAVKPVLARLRESGFWVSDDLYARILQETGE